MTDASYQPKIYREQGGDSLVLLTGATLDMSDSTSHGKGIYVFDLANARELATNATQNIAANGGILASDTTPVFERVNAATDIAFRLKWAASNSDEIQLPIFVYPMDLDDTAAVVVKLWAGMAGATDTPVIAVKYFEGVGDSNAGGNSGALSSTAGVVSVSVAAADIGAYPNFANIALVPGAHTTDALYVYAAWIEYTKKTVLA